MAGNLVKIEGRKPKEQPRCSWCGSEVVHLDYSCPRIEAVDFYDCGAVARVELSPVSSVTDDGAESEDQDNDKESD